MNYIVLDMEWNQPYSKYKKHIGSMALRGEIIQIGAVRLNSRFKISGKFDMTIKPRFYKKLNHHVEKITGITQTQLDASDDFEKVFKKFLKFCGKNCALVTWGTDDIPMLRDNLCAYGIDPVVLPKYYNLQVIFNQQITHQNKQWSLDSAIEHLGIEENEHPHNALYDAISTAHIVAAIDFKNGVAEYDAMGTDNGVKHIEFRGFRTAREALADKRVLFTACPVCKDVLKNSGWTGSRLKKQTTAKCKTHGVYLYRASVVKSSDTFSVHKKITYMP